MFDRTLFVKLARRKPNPKIARSPTVVPLPILDGLQPVSLIFDQRDLAINLAYERYPEPGGTRVRWVSADTLSYWVPRMTPVFAVSEGVIVYAHKQAVGHTIIIDHCNNWLTVYHGLEHMFVAPSELVPHPDIKVAAGDVLGYVAPSQYLPMTPLKFELWKCDPQQGCEQIDPLRYIRRWHHIDWSAPTGGVP